MNKISLLFILLPGCFATHAQSNKPMSQYPSPMQEYIRPHTRIPSQQYTGYTFKIDHLLPKSVSIYLPLKTARAASADLLIQFFGPEKVVSYAAEHYQGNLIAVSVNLGSGSSVYQKPFSDTALFDRLLDSIQAVITKNLHHPVRVRHIIVSGFSAGYGAVRAILGSADNIKKIDGVLLLDGLHAGYVPERKVLADGGRIDTAAYLNFLKFCRLACEKHSRKKFLFTHSEIFPGTFVSTTESARYLLQNLHVKARPVLKRGPAGMQQISDAKKNCFEIMGFAGNSAPDHIDHLEGLYYFLRRLQKL